jgi:VIT1/CCC1 family predicted Fe2+/Mn2+ transporter
VGLVPLLLYVYDYIWVFTLDLFLWTSIFTGIAFMFIGWLKSYVTHTNRVKGVLETLTLGILAATVSYFVGDWIEGLIS